MKFDAKKCGRGGRVVIQIRKEYLTIDQVYYLSEYLKTKQH